MKLHSFTVHVGLFAIGAAWHATAATGGSFCGALGCVSGVVNGSETIYTMNTTTSSVDVGWMALGFGRSMFDSLMVIMWENYDGLVLAQREATENAKSQAPPSPPSVATIRADLSSLTGSTTKFSFSIPSSGQTSEDMIYALGTARPNTNNISAILDLASASYYFNFDLTSHVADLPSTSPSGKVNIVARAPLTGTSASRSRPYTIIEKKLLAHGILSALGFCFFLPIGVLQARFLRIWWPNWFKTHWIVQAGLAGPCIITGYALAVHTVEGFGIKHYTNKHTIIGLVLFVLYLCQILYGIAIHLVKNPNRRRRPIQNYGHAILGLGIISLALYQVWLGFTFMWPLVTRRQSSHGWKVFWIIWIVVLAVAYVGGLTLLRRQYKVEKHAIQDNQGRNTGVSVMNAQPEHGPDA